MGELSTPFFIVFDVSDYAPEEIAPKVYERQLVDGSREFEVWIEGYAATGEHGEAQRLNLTGQQTMWKGNDFKCACLNAIMSLDWELKYYDGIRNTYWACRFFDNEVDARKSFG
jgi:hypothetical protein